MKKLCEKSENEQLDIDRSLHTSVSLSFLSFF